MAKPEPHRGFTVGVEVVPGTTLAQARGLERRIEDYADAHELQIAGHHLTYIVSAAERSLTAVDQVDLLDWLIDLPGVRNVRLSPLSCSDTPATWSEGFVLVASYEVPVIGLTLVYRCGRITAEQYLQILGGFMRPALVH